jgi:hypothetical protein
VANRLTYAALSVTLVGIGAFVYTSPTPPAGGADRRLAADAAHHRTDRGTAGPAAREGARRPLRPPQGRSALDGLPATPVRGAGVRTVRVVRERTRVVRVPAPGPTRPAPPTTRPGGKRPLPGGPRIISCADFRWQQDAQAAYIADLNDPYGLDGPPGPRNDDGIACSLLPVDPTRPPSVPVWPAPPPPPPPEPLPATPTMAELLAPSRVYYGVSTPDAPHDFKDFEIFVSRAGKRPNLIHWFHGWDRDFNPELVIRSWRRGALPLITWEPRATIQPDQPGYDNTNDGIKLARIIDGTWDPYIDAYAAAVRDLGLPVAIRFAHEMNGNWFPWSEERNGNQRGDYVQAWRHVWSRFAAAGATNVIWVWSPNVVTGRPSVRLAPLYPGDDVVDFVGVVGYYRRVIIEPDGRPKPATFDNTYRSTLDELRTFTAKPIMLTEVGATEIGGKKAEWMTSFFETLPRYPDIIGFVWFNHSVNGNDWRIESSRRATEIFRAGVADERYGEGRWSAR